MALIADGKLANPGYPGSAHVALVPPDYAVIRDAGTGAIVAIVKPPSPLNSFFAGGTRLFLARLNPATGAVRLTALPLRNVPPAASLPTGLALSADGSQIAVAYTQEIVARARTCIGVYSVRRTSMKVWEGTGNQLRGGT